MNAIFKLKIYIFFLNRGDKPVLKFFIIKLHFYKSNFETQFANWHILRENLYKVIMPVFGHIFRDIHAVWWFWC